MSYLVIYKSSNGFRYLHKDPDYITSEYTDARIFTNLPEAQTFLLDISDFFQVQVITEDEAAVLEILNQ